MSMTSVKIENLARDSFDTWKMQVLFKNYLWEYANGSCTNTQDVTQAAVWTKNDAKDWSDLILSINPSELKQIKDCESSNEIWSKLHSIYQSRGPARTGNLFKQLQFSKMKFDENFKDHLNKFFDIIDKLNELEINIHEDLIIIMLLYSLPENFHCDIESRDKLSKPEIKKNKYIY